jgi:hypothetical protein
VNSQLQECEMWPVLHAQELANVTGGDQLQVSLDTRMKKSPQSSAPRLVRISLHVGAHRRSPLCHLRSLNGSTDPVFDAAKLWVSTSRNPSSSHL